ncbi:MAG: hypothetical protein GOMPHAMPRED_007972 [Gomphillus americanus]|uniref:WLM domain-containing protein n=1 Tax=Gomphillus americanus TaxID=1940652 RepID=A0A8H3EVT1_9LECA|nr:MAG: hypothetical protein GOMPHAMPRED_007972 [Gomphillus americanus]
MNPAEHTTHESKTLGLNRNHGQVIELRLRTDAYDGYRDYKTIRKTLCHELAHNVHGEHDRKFWELMKQIENEVERADWTRGGYRLSEEVFYQPGEEEEEELGHVDQGAWTGGEWVLGDGSGSGISGISSGSGGSGVSGISGGFSARQASGELGQGSSGGDIMNGGQDTSRREAMAKAAEARIRLKQQQQQQQGQQQGQQQQKQKQKPKGEEEEKK